MNGGANHEAGKHGTVFIVCPGGLEHGGGIGRQMGYFLQAPAARHAAWQYRVVDSRGPWFLSASSRRKFAAAATLLRAIATLAAARLAAAPGIAHVNITGRGSTLRKLILLNAIHACGLRYVLHVHDPAYADDFSARGPRMRSAIAAAFRRAETILLLGQNERARLVKLMRLHPEKARVLHNAVPDPCPALPKPAGATCQLLFLGYLSARKGVPELLQALASAECRSANWRLALAGDGPVQEFRDLAAELGIAERVEFPGWLDAQAASAACAASDAVVLPSHAEGLAMAVLEGLAHGLAVITTPVGAHAEVIEPGVSGLLVPPGDVAALAQALHNVISDTELRARLQHGARQRYLAGFAIDPYAARLARLHGELLGQPHAAAASLPPLNASQPQRH
jgi:glycosyltransferase involved in cell wall biosynthesis